MVTGLSSTASTCGAPKYREVRISWPPADPMISSRSGGVPRIPKGIARVGLEARLGCGVAVELPDPGPVGAVVREEPVRLVLEELDDVDTEHRTPLGVQRAGRVHLGVLDPHIGQRGAADDDDREADGEQGAESEEQ